jgi:hypothetical protein
MFLIEKQAAVVCMTVAPSFLLKDEALQETA